MDLSGQFIKGTGSYEVKEIAPPVESGNIIFTGLWITGSNWSIVNDIGIGIATTGNLYKAAKTKNGRWYRVVYTIFDYVSGTVRVRTSFDVAPDRSANGIYTEYIKCSGDGDFLIDGVSAFTGKIDLSTLVVEEVPEGYPLMDKGDTYLECTASGTVAFPSDQAYGEWEFDCYKDDVEIRWYFINNSPLKKYSAAEAYMLYITSNEAVSLYRSGTGDQLFITADNYIDINTWYRIKITRTLDGTFSVYIKGGAFGLDEWIIVNPSGGSGTNPAIDNTHKTSMYQSFDNDIRDRIANIKMIKAVEQ